MQTTSTGAASLLPAGGDDFLAATEAAAGLRIFYTITIRADNKGLGNTEAFAACLQQSLTSASC
jgi:hypothetical protein